MSLINQMLTDLDRRNAAAAVPGGGVLENLGPVEPSVTPDRGARGRRWSPIMMIMIGMMVMTILIVAAIASAPLSTWLAVITEHGKPPNAGLDESPPGGFLTARDVSQPAARASRRAAPSAGATTEITSHAGPYPMQISKRLSAASAASGAVISPITDAPTDATGREAARTTSPGAATVHPPPRALAATPSAPSTSIPLAKIPMPSSPPDLAESVYRDAVMYLRRGRSRDAETLFRQALEIHPVHVKAREVLAGELTRQGRLGSAATLLHEGLELDPGQSQLAKLYARILVEQGRPTAALDVLQSHPPALEADPEHHAFAAALLSRAGRHADAVEIYRRVLVVMPRQAAWWMGLGLALEGSGEPRAAVAAYRRARHHGGLSDKVQQYIDTRLESLRG